MSRLGEFVAFRAALALLEENDMNFLLDHVYQKCKADKEEIDQPNHVKEIYAAFTYEEVSAKIAEIVRPEGLTSELEVVFQRVDNLHRACPNHLGDWYFTGDYPTPGGNKVVNRAFMNFMEGKLVRAY